MPTILQCISQCNFLYCSIAQYFWPYIWTPIIIISSSSSGSSSSSSSSSIALIITFYFKIIQRRTDGSEIIIFYRTWNEYIDGFGDLSNGFWLGKCIVSLVYIVVLNLYNG